MESLDRFWYYFKATQGPHCCMFNFRTAENSYRGRDIWRKVPGKAEDGCRNQVETALSRSIARRTDTLWNIPQMGTSAALCHLAKTPVCVWPALSRPKQPPPPKPPSYYPNPSYMSSNPLVEPTPSQDRHKVKEQNFHNCCAEVSQPLPYTLHLIHQQ